MGEFWQTVFSRFGVKILSAITWHAQANGQDKRSNQTVKIAIRKISMEHPKSQWPTMLPTIEAVFNNSTNATTGFSPNKIIYGFRLNKGLKPTRQTAIPPAVLFKDARQQTRQKASDAIAFANVAMKRRYDSTHQWMKFKPGDLVYLRLHHGYKLPGEPNRKFFRQCAGPIKVLKRVSQVVYKLDIPLIWKIHPVVSVAQLEAAPNNQDPFEKPRFDKPGPVEQEGQLNNEAAESYKILRLLKKQTRKQSKTTILEYLVRWKGYGLKFDA